MSLEIPFTSEHQFVHAYKTSRRKEDDLALVCACFSVVLEPTAAAAPTIVSSCFSFGGVAAYTVLASRTMAHLKGKPLTRAVLTNALDILAEEMHVAYTVPGGLPEYRRSMVTRCVPSLFLSLSTIRRPRACLIWFA